MESSVLNYHVSTVAQNGQHKAFHFSRFSPVSPSNLEGAGETSLARSTAFSGTLLYFLSISGIKHWLDCDHTTHLLVCPHVLALEQTKMDKNISP